MSPCPQRPPRPGQAGLTLIEMLAVMLLVGLVVTSSASFYFQLSQQSNRAVEDTRAARRATAALDRLARELESAVLVEKPDERDPLDHPWLFFAEREGGGEGANRIKFNTRAHRPRSDGAHQSDLATVAWALRRDGGGSAELMRWASPRLPESLDRRVPEDPADGAQLVVEDVARFSLRFLSEEGEWKERWDSSTVPDSSRLPRAVEIALALAPPADATGEPAFEPEPLRRQVVLALRPLDLEALLSGEDGAEGGGGEDEEGEGEGDTDTGSGESLAEGTSDDDRCRVTVAQCIARHPEIPVDQLLQAAGLPPGIVSQLGGECAADFANVLPLPADCR